MVDFLPQAFPGMWSIQLLHHSGCVHVLLMIKICKLLSAIHKNGSDLHKSLWHGLFCYKVHTHTHTHMYTSIYVHVPVSCRAGLSCTPQVWEAMECDTLWSTSLNSLPISAKWIIFLKRSLSICTFGGRSTCTAGKVFSQNLKNFSLPFLSNKTTRWPPF